LRPILPCRPREAHALRVWLIDPFRWCLSGIPANCLLSDAARDSEAPPGDAPRCTGRAVCAAGCALRRHARAGGRRGALRRLLCGPDDRRPRGATERVGGGARPRRAARHDRVRRGLLRPLAADRAVVGPAPARGHGPRRARVPHRHHAAVERPARLVAARVHAAPGPRAGVPRRRQPARRADGEHILRRPPGHALPAALRPRLVRPLRPRQGAVDEQLPQRRLVQLRHRRVGLVGRRHRQRHRARAGLLRHPVLPRRQRERRVLQRRPRFHRRRRRLPRRRPRPPRDPQRDEQIPHRQGDDHHQAGAGRALGGGRRGAHRRRRRVRHPGRGTHLRRAGPRLGRRGHPLRRLLLQGRHGGPRPRARRRRSQPRPRARGGRPPGALRRQQLPPGGESGRVAGGAPGLGRAGRRQGAAQVGAQHGVGVRRGNAQDRAAGGGQDHQRRPGGGGCGGLAAAGSCTAVAQPELGQAARLRPTRLI
ncbi:hypothetical protein DFJ74DRAFT_757520, partial [Hyaloraphidium curvatum]